MCTVLVLISQIKEIRVGRNTDILRNRELESTWQDVCIFSVIFGDNFESLDLIANNADEANIWVTGLTYLTTGRHKSGAACLLLCQLFVVIFVLNFALWSFSRLRYDMIGRCQCMHKTKCIIRLDAFLRIVNVRCILG